jgi:hypothetical protein
VEGVLVIALARSAGLLEEQHRLQGEHVGADQRLDHVEDARVQEEALVDRQLAVEHVHARVRAVGQILDVSQQLVHLVGRHQAAHDQEALLLVADEVLDGNRAAHEERG